MLDKRIVVDLHVDQDARGKSGKRHRVDKAKYLLSSALA